MSVDSSYSPIRSRIYEQPRIAVEWVQRGKRHRIIFLFIYLFVYNVPNKSIYFFPETEEFAKQRPRHGAKVERRFQRTPVHCSAAPPTTGVSVFRCRVCRNAIRKSTFYSRFREYIADRERGQISLWSLSVLQEKEQQPSPSVLAPCQQKPDRCSPPPPVDSVVLARPRYPEREYLRVIYIPLTVPSDYSTIIRLPFSWVSECEGPFFYDTYFLRLL